MNREFNEFTTIRATALTRREALKRLSLGFTGLGLTRLGLREAKAITNGQLDGNAHPNVGGFVWLQNIWSPDPPPVFVGTATLIHPRVVLTAGHGTHAIESAIANGTMTINDVLISFASDATDPTTWRGISRVITHPAFDIEALALNGQGNLPIADVGVAILREPVNTLPLTPLPPLGFLDALQAAGPLNAGSESAQFTVVGYGTELGPNNGHWPWPPDGKRRVAQTGFHDLHDHWLFLDQNPAQGLGGTGYGDSGGPTYWVDPSTGQTTLVALTSRGSWTLETQYRVDTSEALTFLNGILAGV